MFRYEYIALLDIDEVIMPLVHNSWAEMMEAVVAASLKVRPKSVGISACDQSGKERVGLVWFGRLNQTLRWHQRDRRAWNLQIFSMVKKM